LDSSRDLYWLTSEKSFCCCCAESLRFYWWPLTSSPNEEFSDNNCWIFLLKSSDYLDPTPNLSLCSLISEISFCCWTFDNLSFSWPSLNSSCKSLFYEVIFLNCSVNLLRFLWAFYPYWTRPVRVWISLFLFSTMLLSLSISLVTIYILYSYWLTFSENSLSFLLSPVFSSFNFPNYSLSLANCSIW
jgi:hypothetical protein